MNFSRQGNKVIPIRPAAPDPIVPARETSRDANNFLVNVISCSLLAMLAVALKIPPLDAFILIGAVCCLDLVKLRYWR